MLDVYALPVGALPVGTAPVGTVPVETPAHAREEGPPIQPWVIDLYRMVPQLCTAGPQEVAQRLLECVVAGFGAAGGTLALHATGTAPRLTVVTGRVGDSDSATRARDITECSAAGDVGWAICWPLACDDVVVGSLRIDRGSHATPFTPADLAPGDLVHGIIAVAIANAQLRAEHARYVATASTLNATVHRMNGQLEQTHGQLLQADKMASIGQLAAGLAHEINNPIGYVNANLGSLEQFLQELFAVLAAYDLVDHELPEQARRQIEAVKVKADLAYLRKDSFALLGECREGIGRVRKIVQDLRDFSHVDTRDEWRFADVHKGLDSTLNIVNNEIKYKATVVKEYGQLPEVECLPAQLNQVFMNILMNTAQSMQGSGTITVRTGVEGDAVWIAITDTGCGIPSDQVTHIFEPFFTTKKIGEGTGLGLSLSYGIVEKHDGAIDVESAVGIGTTFRITLPLERRIAARRAGTLAGMPA